MIQMVNGVYGHYTGTIVERKDKNSPPFSLTPEQEARLVEIGVAVYVEPEAAELPEPPEPEPKRKGKQKQDDEPPVFQPAEAVKE